MFMCDWKFVFQALPKGATSMAVPKRAQTSSPLNQFPRAPSAAKRSTTTPASLRGQSVSSIPDSNGVGNMNSRHIASTSTITSNNNDARTPAL